MTEHSNPHNGAQTVEHTTQQHAAAVGGAVLGLASRSEDSTGLMHFDTSGTNLAVPGEAAQTISDADGRQALKWLGKDVAYAWHEYGDGGTDVRPPYNDQEEVITTATAFLKSRPVEYLERPVTDDPDDNETWGNYVSASTYREFYLGDIETARLMVAVDDSEPEKAEIGLFDLQPSLRGKGMGSRIMRSAVSQLKDEGVQQLFSRNITLDALRVRIAVFGEANLEFLPSSLEVEGGADQPPAPRSLAEAKTMLEEIYANAEPARLEEDGQIAIPTFGIKVDLGKINTTNWERPVLNQQS